MFRKTTKNNWSSARIITTDYDGRNGYKKTLIKDNEVYMIKSQTRNNQRFVNTNQSTISSYNNSIYSEYIASNVINIIQNGLSHYTNLIVYDNRNYVACKNFCLNYLDNQLVNNKMIISVKSIIRNAIEGSTIANLDENTLEDNLKFIEHQELFDKNKLLEFFWKQFVLDAFNLNRDRHTGNWALLYDLKLEEYQIAPIYDNGSCLLAKNDFDEIINLSLNNFIKLNGYLKDRISKTKHYLKLTSNNSKRLTYLDFLLTTKDVNCHNALKWIYQEIDLDKISEFINSSDLIDEYKVFYKKLYQISYELLIKKPLQNNPYIDFKG